MTNVCTTARAGPRRIVYSLAALAGVATGLAIGLPAFPVPGPIPSAARVVTVTPVFGLQPDISREAADRAFTLTDPATVAKIAAVIDSLSPVPPGWRRTCRD
jgi:hypothetical protein